MVNEFLLAIFSDGTVIRLDSSSQLPSCDVIAIVRCTYDRPTHSKKNHHYTYAVFNAQLNKIESNCLEWSGYKCWIGKRDEWRPPHPDSLSNKEMRIEVVVEKSNGESVVMRFQHKNCFGSGFMQLLGFLKMVGESGDLYTCYHSFKKEL